MAEVNEFAHGYHYGDYSGIVFYGPPVGGFWLDRLAVSDCYIHPLFGGILDRARESGGEVSRVASDWNALQGWAAADGPVAIAPTDAGELAEALGKLAPTDVVDYCAGCTIEECMRCAVVIRDFIVIRLSRGASLFIEDD